MGGSPEGLSGLGSSRRPKTVGMYRTPSNFSTNTVVPYYAAPKPIRSPLLVELLGHTEAEAARPRHQVEQLGFKVRDQQPSLGGNWARDEKTVLACMWVDGGIAGSLLIGVGE